MAQARVDTPDPAYTDCIIEMQVTSGGATQVVTYRVKVSDLDYEQGRGHLTFQTKAFLRQRLEALISTVGDTMSEEF